MESSFALALADWRLAWPLALSAIVLPWCLRGWRSDASRQAGGIDLPFANRLPGRSRSGATGGNRLDASGWLVVVLLALAAARPQWIETVTDRSVSGRDLLLVLDVSASMKTADLQAGEEKLSRLTAATRLASAFLDRRPGDRVGLIVFASRPYLYVPLTHDLAAVGHALDGLAVGLAGDQTALGDALALAVRNLSEASGAERRTTNSDDSPNNRVVIVISDGDATSGALTPAQASWLAAQRQVRVHALMVGAAAEAPSLRLMAEQTAGSYARAADTAGVAGFFKRIDQLDAASLSASPSVGVAREAYIIPLALALLILVGRQLQLACRQRPGDREMP